MDFVLKDSESIIEYAKKLNSELIVVELIKSREVRDLKRQLDKANGLVVVEGGDDQINRTALESKKVDILLSPEKDREKDFMKVRDSGLNQVLCKLAKNNNIAIGFNFNDILNANSLERSRILGKMIQNVDLCKKYKVRTVVGSFASRWEDLRSESDLESFARVIGIEKVNNKNVISKLKNKKDYIIDGVKLLK